jgi:predicted lipoprotein
LSPVPSSEPSQYPSSNPEKQFLTPTQSLGQPVSEKVYSAINPALIAGSSVAVLGIAAFTLVYFKKLK